MTTKKAPRSALILLGIVAVTGCGADDGQTKRTRTAPESQQRPVSDGPTAEEAKIVEELALRVPVSETKSFGDADGEPDVLRFFAIVATAPQAYTIGNSQWVWYWVYVTQVQKGSIPVGGYSLVHTCQTKCGRLEATEGDVSRLRQHGYINLKTSQAEAADNVIVRPRQIRNLN
jgi:predicted phage gp36 major capsid-like protein